MDPEKIVIFPWGTDIETFHPRKFRSNLLSKSKVRKSEIVNYDNFLQPHLGIHLWRGCAGEGVCQSGEREPDVNLILLGGGSQGAKIRQI
jgi:hypothetical protein